MKHFADFQLKEVVIHALYFLLVAVAYSCLFEASLKVSPGQWTGKSSLRCVPFLISCTIVVSFHKKEMH